MFEEEIYININKKWWHQIFYINSHNMYGSCRIKVYFDYLVDGKRKQCLTNNYPNSTIDYLDCHISNDFYPRKKGLIYGDLHYHTNLTEDMVEFGAPIYESLKVSQSMGLDFICCTDHSYDLDDKVDSWTETDPELLKWKNSRKYIEKINR